jgi:hypothetical protein
MNGKEGDDPILDITLWKLPRFSPVADALIVEIVQLGGQVKLEREFNLSQPPPCEQFEGGLQQLRDRAWKDRKERGWEL